MESNLTHDLAKEILTLISSTKDFTVAHLPDVCSELVLRNGWWSLLQFTVLPALIIVAILVFLRIFLRVINTSVEGQGDRDLLKMMSIIVSTVSTIILICVIIKHGTAAIQVILFPKAFLFEYFTKFIT